MIKRKLCLLLSLSLCLTGCSSLTMNTSESSQVAEYIAYSLLKYHKPESIVVSEQFTESEENVQEPVATDDKKEDVQASPSVQPENSKPEVTPTEDTKVISAGELFGSSDFQISIRNKGLYKSYPKDSSSTYFSLSASAGKKILVLALSAKNTGTTKQQFRTSGTGLGFALAGKAQNKALVTILEHDIHFVKSMVKPGKSIHTLLFFEVDENFSLDNVKVTLSKSGKSIDVPVKNES